MKTDKPLEYDFNHNIISRHRIWGVGKRNIIEGAISTIIADLIILAIPFVSEVKIVLLISVSAVVLIFNIRGICNRSVSEIIIDEIKYQNRKRELHLRGPEYVKEKTTSYGGGYSDQSIAEQAIGKIKERIDEFLEKNDRERHS